MAGAPTTGADVIVGPQISEPSWTVEDARELYAIPRWGKGYVDVSDDGRLLVLPEKDPARSLDLYGLIQGLSERGLKTPLLVRLPDLLHYRIREIASAFRGAIEQEGYRGSYRCVFPVKVNQQRSVLEEVRDLGGPFGFGLEAGSKPELLAVLGLSSGRPEMPIVCNGFKDSEFIEMVILATKLGRRITTIVEKASELELIVRHAERYGVEPRIGLRVRVSAPGSGRWEASGGVKSKFGLSIGEVLEAVDHLRAHGMLHCLDMLHAHIGSQVADIRFTKNAITELAHIYTELRRLGSGLTALNIGGGLGVDYDGSESATDASVNYSVEEYAADVVYRVRAVCDEAGQPHPDIFSESGRALAAYSSILLFDVLGASRLDGSHPPASAEELLDGPDDETPQPLADLFDAWERVHDGRLVEVYHDAAVARDELISLFSLGYVSLPQRAAAEQLFWATARKLLERSEAALASGELESEPAELLELRKLLSDRYYGNLSIFQSLPDAWAIDQLFPVCPVHRLDERPTRYGVLHDVTCDSDGKIDRFINPESPREPKAALELHELRPGERYYLAVFLVGAYQEILGDLHNLFGDTNAVHVSLDPEDGHVCIDEVIKGDTVAQTLGYVQIDSAELTRSMRRDAERAVRAGRLTPGESGALMRFYEENLKGYTYLEE